MPSSRASRPRAVVYLCAAVLAVMLLISGVVQAQTPPTPECLDDLDTLIESLNCTGLPTIDKYYDPMTFSWRGSQYLVVNSGNDLALWNISNPQSPVEGDASNFGVPNQGDSNHDLVAYSICDDCRWGAAAFKLGTLLFDLGTGASPSFGTKQFYPSVRPYGAFTFMYNSQQYLLANHLPDDCGEDATLYRFNGVTSIEAIGCVDVPGISTDIANGVKVEGGGGTYLYLGFSSAGVYIYEVQPVGNLISLVDTGHAPLVAFMGRGKGLSVDHDADLAVTASFGDGLRIYDISDPASPLQLSSVPGTFTVAAANYPFVWTARLGYTYTERTFLIDDPENPVELDPNFWDPLQPWNNHSDQCEYPNGAVFSSDAMTMYLARHAVLQYIDFTACAGPIQPTADMSMTPTPAFPGDSVTVTNASIGTVETKTIWVTDSSNPMGNIICGDRVLTAGDPNTLACQIPANIEAAAVRYAHVAVANTDFPCAAPFDATSCPGFVDQLATEQVVIDRAPDAVITIVPPNPITGGTISLQGTAEGSPAAVPFEWRVTDPGNVFTDYTGNPVTGVELDQMDDAAIGDRRMPGE